ncbi:TonB-dependent receptor plug domain-containing protein [Halomonas sp. BBD45]
MKKTFTYGLLMAAGSAALSAHAQQDQDTMVVVGSRTPTQISQIPGAVWVVDKEALHQQISTGADLKSALGRLVPGLDFAPQGRTNYGQNMRGRSVQVLIDGISMNSTRGLSRQFDSIDPFNIERIEVLSGASSLYGGGATGGIINIVTKKGETGGPSWGSEVGVTSGFQDSDDLDYRVAQSISGGN